MSMLASIRLPSSVDAETAGWLAELSRQGMAANTLTATHAAARYWAAWHLARFGAPMDLLAGVPVDVALTFVADHGALKTPTGAATAMPAHVDASLVKRGAKRRPGPPAYRTWQQRLSLMSKALSLLGLPNGCSAPAVLELVSRAKRPAATLGLLGQRRPAILSSALNAMLATCGEDPAGVRDRALLLFAFASGGRRRSEIAGARLEDLRAIEHEGEAAYLFALAGAKRQEPGQVRHKPVRGSAAVALAVWLRMLEAHGMVSGPLFRAVKGETWIGQAALSGQAVNLIVKRRAEAAKLPANLTAHGLRGGFLTQAYRDGVNLFDAMALSDHRDVKTVREHYLEDFDALRNPAGILLERDKEKGGL